MLIKKADSIKKENSKSCVVFEYEFHNNQIGFATAHINGRYPIKGKAVNTKSNLIYFVLSGSGLIHTVSGDFEIRVGDAFLLEANEWYLVEGKDLFIALPSSPAWNLDQYKEVS